MNQFLKRLGLFVMPVLAIALLLELLLRSLPNSYDIKSGLLEENASKIEVVLLGTSHTFSGINPAQFEEFTVNIANNSQSLYYDLMILEKHLDKLPNLKMVVFEINFFSLNYNLDKGTESWRNKFYYQSYDIQPQSVKLNFLDKIRLLNLNSSEITLLFKNYSLNQMYKHNFGFSKNDVVPTKINEVTAEHRFNQLKNEFINSATDKTLFRYRETLETLSRKGVKIVFVQTPVSKPLCRFLQNTNITKELDKLDQSILQFQIKNLNYLCDPRFDDSLFVDTDHLSYEGAKLLTSILINDLKTYTLLETEKIN